MEFDITSLIKEIKARKPLWQKDNCNHSCRDVINNLWIEVANKMGVSKDLVKTKWKGLRDNFRSELRKIPKKKHHLHTSKWIYFSDMMFLKDQMIKKPSKTIISGDAEDVNVDVDVYTMDDADLDNDECSRRFQYQTGTLMTYPNNCYGFVPYSVSLLPTDCSVFSYVESNSSVNQVQHCHELSSGDICNTMWDKIAVKRRKVNNLFTNDDEDYSFLMSLLPMVRTLAPDKKMFLRLKLQKLVFNEVYNCSTDFSNKLTEI